MKWYRTNSSTCVVCTYYMDFSCFLPLDILAVHSLSCETKMPPYPGVSQVMELPNKQTTSNEKDSDDWALEYESYLASKETETATPNRSSKTDATRTNEGGDGGGNDDEEWTRQYAEHCAEQEERLPKILE